MARGVWIGVGILALTMIWGVGKAFAANLERDGIRSINSTSKSIEEIATHMLHEAHLVRRVY